MFENKIRILLVDDDKDEYYILRALLDRIEDMVYELDWLYDYDKALNLMVSNEYDIYLLDYRLGIYNGIELMKDALNNGCDSPVIILTGQGERKIDIAAMRAGASDYMLKDEMQSHFLERSIRYAIERKKAQVALLESENRYRDLLENATDMILNIDINGSFLYVNNRWRNTLNYSEEELRGMTIRDVIYPGYKEQFDKAFEKLISGVKIDLLETAFVSKKGNKIDAQGNLNCKLDNNDRIISLRAIFRNVSARKKAERERDRIFELSRDLIAVLDYDVRFLDLNPSWSRVLGYNIEKFKFMDMVKLIHPDDLPLLRKKIRSLKKGIPAQPKEIRFKSQGDYYKWFSLSIALEPKEKRIYVIARDITDIKQSQIELQDSEKRYRDLIEYNRGLIFTHDLDGLILSANNAVAKTLGYPRDEIVGQNMEKFFFPEDKRKLKRYLTSVRRKSVVHGTIDVKNRDGQLITLTYQNFKHKPQDKKEYIIGNAQDITDRVRAEEALMRERQQLRDTIENAPVPMALLDRDLRFITCSRKWLQEYKPANVKTVVGRTYFDLYPWIDNKWVQYSRKVLDGKVLSKSEDVFELVNGKKIYFSWAMHPWKDENGTVNGLIIVAERIDDLVKARDAAEMANKAKSTFLANVTHELRTPLNAILGYAQILAKDRSITEYQNEYITNMYRSGMHLLSMINDILDLSKIEAGKAEINIEDIDLNDLLDEIYSLFELKSREKGIEFLLHKSEELPQYVKMDISKIRQILINIVGNSMKYTEKGHITIKACIDKEKQNGENTLLNISITDTGRGIPQYQLQDIFEPFSQVKGEHNKGTGLGLTISKRLAQLLGGEIEVKSEWKVGSEFILRVPVKIVSNKKQSVKNIFSHVKSVKNPNVIKVLIVDDVDYNRTVLRVMLQQVGFDCYEVGDGATAISRYKEIKPDIVFIDKHLPDMSGSEVMHKIRSIDDSSNAVIFALTASGIGDSRTSYIEQGFDDFLRKPFTEEEIFEIIQQHTEIEYEYENRETSHDKKTLNEVIQDTVSELSKLPEDLRQRIRNALEWQDMEELNWLINGIENFTSKDNVAANQIKNAINRSDYYFITMLYKSMNQQLE